MMTKLSLALPKYEAAINGLRDEVHLTLHMQGELLRLFPLTCTQLLDSFES